MGNLSPTVQPRSRKHKLASTAATSVRGFKVRLPWREFDRSERPGAALSSQGDCEGEIGASNDIHRQLTH